MCNAMYTNGMSVRLLDIKTGKFRDMIGTKNTILRVISEYIVFTAKELYKIS